MITLTFDPNATAHVLSIMQAQQGADVNTLLNAAAVNVIAACEQVARERPDSGHDEQEEARADAILQVALGAIRWLVGAHSSNVRGTLPPGFIGITVQATLEADELGRDIVRFKPLEIERTGGE